MGLVDDHDWVWGQVRRYHELSEQHTVCHVLDHGVLGGVVFKADRVTDLLSQLNPHLLTDSCCNTHSCHSPRLCTTHLPPQSVPLFVEILGKLGGLTRTRLPYHDDDLVVSDETHKLLSILKNRQRLLYYLHRTLLGLHFRQLNLSFWPPAFTRTLALWIATSLHLLLLGPVDNVFLDEVDRVIH